MNSHSARKTVIFFPFPQWFRWSAVAFLILASVAITVVFSDSASEYEQLAELEGIPAYKEAALLDYQILVISLVVNLSCLLWVYWLFGKRVVIDPLRGAMSVRFPVGPEWRYSKDDILGVRIGEKPGMVAMGSVFVVKKFIWLIVETKTSDICVRNAGTKAELEEEARRLAEMLDVQVGPHERA